MATHLWDLGEGRPRGIVAQGLNRTEADGIQLPAETLAHDWEG